ncbi:MAG: GntR family transcriptional regulator [bacterium]|nr:GntR family transcriptional regulator [bacterium]
MLKFNIDGSSPIPVYQQVKRCIILEMISGKLKEGDRLPSIRSLSKILKLNNNTIAKAYYSLDDEGVIEGIRGSGYIVKKQKSKLDNLKQSLLEEEIKQVIEKAFSMGFSKTDILKITERLLS